MDRLDDVDIDDDVDTELEVETLKGKKSQWYFTQLSTHFFDEVYTMDDVCIDVYIVLMSTTNFKLNN